jgi:two-component system chemotaxis response regulator CheB
MPITPIPSTPNYMVGVINLLEMKCVGAFTIAQDEATSVIWGMPGEAVKMGAAQQVIALEQVPAAIIKAAPQLRGE